MSIQKYMPALVLSLSILVGTSQLKAQVITETKSIRDANVKVYVSTYEAEADVVVFKTPFIKNASGNNGIWHFTTVGGEANKRICFVSSKTIADIVICYTTNSSQAGWKNKRKKHFMD